MKLYIIIYERDGGCDWFFHTSEKNLNEYDKEVRALIAEHYDIDVEMLEDCITDYWVNVIDEVDGYKVKLVKE